LWLKMIKQGVSRERGLLWDSFPVIIMNFCEERRPSKSFLATPHDEDPCKKKFVTLEKSLRSDNLAVSKAKKDSLRVLKRSSYTRSSLNREYLETAGQHAGLLSRAHNRRPARTPPTVFRGKNTETPVEKETL